MAWSTYNKEKAHLAPCTQIEVNTELTKKNPITEISNLCLIQFKQKNVLFDCRIGNSP